MATQDPDLLKKPLYVYDIPASVLSSLHVKSTSTPAPHVEEPTSLEKQKQPRDDHDILSKPGKQGTSCTLCSATFPTFADQRIHVRSDWHNYNLKQKLRNQPPVSETEFDQLIGDLDESISGSESESSSEDNADDRQLSTLLKKQAKLTHGDQQEDVVTVKPRKRIGAGKPPLFWFKSDSLDNNISLGIYRALFTDEEIKDESTLAEIVKRKQLQPRPAKSSGPDLENEDSVASQSNTGPSVFLCMIGGGHFAAMIVSLTPKLVKRADNFKERQAIVIAHKTFHRYTTRRKQGGAQSSNDMAKGNAHSAGAGIRRHNEMALESEIRELLSEWRTMIDGCQLLFVRASGTVNKRVLYGPYDGQVLKQTDSRNRRIPFSTRRATQKELMRAFVELTRVKVSEVDEAALIKVVEEKAREEGKQSAKAGSRPSKPVVPKPSKEDEAALMHTSQLQALIKRSKVPATLSYLSNNSVPPDFLFHPPTTQANHHASTPLHFAASNNSRAIVIALLTKAGANPCMLNGDGKVPFDLAGERQTRDAFRIARHELGEGRWKWEDAHVPPAMTREEADKRDATELAEAQKAEAERRQAETDRLEKEAGDKAALRSKMRGPGKTLSGLEITAADRREQEARSLTPEMRMKLERERRARAAEERINRMTGGR